MNVIEADILKSIWNSPFVNQRTLSRNTGYSLGTVNKSIRNLSSDRFLDNLLQLTPKAVSLLEEHTPANAIILAAGSGMRMVPLNTLFAKALLEVKGERLIERLINQLHETGVTDITIVVGFMKESFEYLIDKYGVKLVVNTEYYRKNNLHSLSLVREQIRNTYIVPCDIRCEINPFSKTELYSWYMVSEQITDESNVYANRKKELVLLSDNETGNRMIGIAYLTGTEADTVRENLKESNDNHPDDYWEKTLINKDRLIVSSKIVKDSDYVEINTYEQLRDIDSNSNHLRSDAIKTISTVFGCSETAIVDIEILKKGMTNRSFLFKVNGTKYIMRIPGEGTDKLIDRHQEADVYKTISGLGLSNEPIYINPENGYKITAYISNTRVCNPKCETDLVSCMRKLKDFHNMRLSVKHDFDIFEHIDYFESLRAGKPSVYADYYETKRKVYELRSFVESLKTERCLTHIDSVPDNFLFCASQGSGEEVLLIDWEYSGMQDPHVDIAMFCIYSLYSKDECDHLIDLYFDGKCDDTTRAKIYCYISMCGLLWSNWCEYKQLLGVEFGEYSLMQYRYAKEYYRHAKKIIEG